MKNFFRRNVKNYFSQICIENCSRMNKHLFYSASTEKKVKIRSPMKETTIQGQQQSFGTIFSLSVPFRQSRRCHSGPWNYPNTPGSQSQNIQL